MPASTDLRPLITAAEIFPELETLCDSAQEELFLCFRIFDPRTRLRGAALRSRGLQSWADLLADVASRGVRLRLIISDFDPLFTSDLHRGAWRAARGFTEAMTGAPDAQILCAPHGQLAGRLWHLAMRRRIRRILARLRTDPAEALTPVQAQLLRHLPILRPVTIHQKFAVADGAQTVLGGLDVDERRWDDPDHDRPANDTWHDVSLAAHGPVCKAVRAHFIDTWNTALSYGAPAVLGEGTKLDEPGGLLPHRPGSGPALKRTVSMPRHWPGALAPRRHVTEHLEALTEALMTARRSIYLETQFFRHLPLARALAQAGRDHPDLNLILLMPATPERVAFEGQSGFDVRHAQALQLRCLAHLDRAFGSRLALVSPVQPRAPVPGETTDHVTHDPIVYVHSKVSLIDDHWGMVGSANLNGRSMHWDTEASLVFTDPGTVTDLRTRLAQVWFGAEAPEGEITLAETWNRAAQRNADRAHDARKGFLMPYPEKATRKFSAYLPVLPADMF
ncbi:phospholipase D family protein [Roseovarius aestuariivivens]|uniref:phospholipase D family protein n=1 Tax=Roseovarius aestuariivivens TaxID=1888910 RepID=UPI001081D46A|nr:phospholipase D family protein [Roseovarius aestuariivivens]